MWKYHMSFALHMGWCLPFARRHMGDPETKKDDTRASLHGIYHGASRVTFLTKASSLENLFPGKRGGVAPVDALLSF